MKNWKFFMVLILPVAFLNCDELKEALEEEVEVTTSYTHRLSFSVLPDSEPAQQFETFINVGSFDLLANPDVTNLIGNPERIKEIEILGVRYELKNFIGNVDANIDNPLFYLATESPGGPPDLVFLGTNANIAEADFFGTLFTVSGNFNGASQRLNQSSRKIFDYVISGIVDYVPATFDIETTFTFRLKLEIDPDEFAVE
ncbi:hypothetical protein [Muriicola sp. Z0-33]|uniref:hypothetical protein n=1 Tax=Muriicola sp. Z0-33 TaxID=2816957 RepID=UPI0022390B07|nr:hypothetical protein [Muriicola sp. Z0-33]MCW5517311.1 hypothetical protein [Muriicola sp. Z0-33]